MSSSQWRAMAVARSAGDTGGPSGGERKSVYPALSASLYFRSLFTSPSSSTTLQRLPSAPYWNTFADQAAALSCQARDLLQFSFRTPCVMPGHAPRARGAPRRSIRADEKMKYRLIRLLARTLHRVVGLPRWRTVLRRVVAASAVLPWLLAASVGGAQAPASPQDFGPVALEQIRQLDLEKASLLPHQRKIDSRLRRMLDATNASPKFPGLASIAHPMPQADGTIALDIDTFASSDVKTVIDAVQASGGTI